MIYFRESVLQYSSNVIYNIIIIIINNFWHELVFYNFDCN